MSQEEFNKEVVELFEELILSIYPAEYDAPMVKAQLRLLKLMVRKSDERSLSNPS